MSRNVNACCLEAKRSEGVPKQGSQWLKGRGEGSSARNKVTDAIKFKKKTKFHSNFEQKKDL